MIRAAEDTKKKEREKRKAAKAWVFQWESKEGLEKGTQVRWTLGKAKKKKRSKEVKKTNCLNRKKKSAAEAVFLEFVSGINTQNYRFRKKLRRKKARMLNSSTNSNRAKKKKLQSPPKSTSRSLNERKRRKRKEKTERQLRERSDGATHPIFFSFVLSPSFLLFHTVILAAVPTRKGGGKRKKKGGEKKKKSRTKNGYTLPQ